MATAAKWIAGCGSAAVVGVIGFGYTNPAWTQRKFNSKKCPPLKYDNPPSRAECVTELMSHGNADAPLDVLVIGGGCVGSATALDAVTRGLVVGLVEMHDYASETSSRSTKLIHGGIRYLQKAVFQLDPMQLKLVAEALRERTIMIHQAPNLCQPLPNLIPCYNMFEVGLYYAGTKVYDLIAALYGGTLKYSGYVWPSETLELYPKLRNTNGRGKSLRGSVRYYDGQMNDARLCFAAAMTAACYGAATVNYAKVTKMETVLNGQGDEVVKSTITDTQNNKTFEVFSKAVVNAGGPFTSEIEKLADSSSGKVDMVPASGTHIVIERKYCPKTHEATVIPSSDGRVVFTIPWLGGCLLGTTDHKCEVTTDPRPPEEDIKFLLNNVEPYVGPVPRDAVKSAWAGIRPLAVPKNQHKEGGTQNIVREHLITVDETSHILNITGGKWTTYRKMAEEAVDQLCSTLLKGKVQASPCISSELVMVGSRNLDSVPASTPSGVPADIDEHWRINYGDRYNEVLAIATNNNNKHMKRLAEGSPVTEADVIWSAKNEHCERVVDFVSRRTRMAFLDVGAAEAAIPRVAELMGSVKKWHCFTTKAEAAHALASMDSFRGC